MRKKFDLSLLPPFPNLAFEKDLWSGVVKNIAGIDEAGRGALAGPVCAGAVILPNIPDLAEKLLGVNDSKKLSLKSREKLFKVIKIVAVGFGVGFSSAEEIDKIGIVPATHLAARRALKKLNLPIDYLLVDAFTLSKVNYSQLALIKGDARSLSIACASILAKVSRDRKMIVLSRKIKQYGFEQHKGYGTIKHRQAIIKYGGSAEHRKTFAPLKFILNENSQTSLFSK